MISTIRRSPRLRRVAAALFFVAAAALPIRAALEATPPMQVVSQLVARIFEQTHYSHRPINAALSRQWLKLYFDYFDYHHMIFAKADIDEFTTRFGDRLGDAIKDGDVTPAYEIFARFLKRLETRKAYAVKIAASNPSFTADESIVPDRHELPWPANEKEAADLWRRRVKYELLQERLSGTKPEEQVKTVTTRYDRLLRSYKEFDSGDVLQAYLSALARSYDPHSDYMAAAQAENFSISMRLSLVGIGAVLRSEDGYAKIVSLVPGGPAATDGRLKPNDRIEAVGQGEEPLTDVVGMKLDRLVQLIRGEKGTTVRLRVIPAESIDSSTRTVISLVRDEIKLTDQEARAKIITTPAAWTKGQPARVGVINLPSFYADLKGANDAKSTTRDVQKLLGRLKSDGIDGLILDLRSNGGGSLSEAIALTRVFINDGPVVQVKDTRGLIKVLRTPTLDNDTIYRGPMAVLTSHTSASASEILAAALQDYGRAVVIGNKSTYGKGTVQSVVELDQYMPSIMRSFKPGSLKLTIQKFYRVTGGSTQDRGVIPDIRLPSLMDLMNITESALTNAMPYDEIPPTPFRRMDTAEPVLPRLIEASLKRVAASPEFDYIRQDMERYKKQQEDKSVSLKESARRAEKKADDDRLAARKAERLTRKKPKLAEVEITLASIDGTEPAAPPAVSTAARAAAGLDDEEEEVKDPSAPDVALEESLRVVADWIALTGRSGKARKAVEKP